MFKYRILKTRTLALEREDLRNLATANHLADLKKEAVDVVAVEIVVVEAVELAAEVVAIVVVEVAEVSAETEVDVVASVETEVGVVASAEAVVVVDEDVAVLAVQINLLTNRLTVVQRGKTKR